MLRIAISTLLLTLVCLAVYADDAENISASNEVVIMLDSSGSYKTRRSEALNKASGLLGAIAQTKVRRWETSGTNITIISLDAVPEVIWSGNLVDLKKLKSVDWSDRFNARTDYEHCTDVDAAFSLAASHLQGDPKYVNKYLFAFSDLINEPPMNSIKKCQPPSRPSLPSEGFQWDSFRDVSVTVFWLPAEQKLAWKRAAEEHGLSSNFALYTTSESGNIVPAAPPKPEIKITAAEKEAEREAYMQWFFSILKWLAGIVVVFVILLVGGYYVGKRYRGRPLGGASPRRQGRQIRPLPESRLIASRRPAQGNVTPTLE